MPVNLSPNTLNLKSKGNWVTAKITLPSEYDPNDVLLPSVMINNSIPADRIKAKKGALMVNYMNNARILVRRYFFLYKLADFRTMVASTAKGNPSLTATGFISICSI